MAGISCAIIQKDSLETVNAFIFLKNIEYLLSKYITDGAIIRECS